MIPPADPKSEIVDPSTLDQYTVSQSEVVSPEELSQYSVGDGEIVDPDTLGGYTTESEERRKARLEQLKQVRTLPEISRMAAEDRRSGDNSLLPEYREKYSELFLKDKNGGDWANRYDPFVNATKWIVEAVKSGPEIVSSLWTGAKNVVSSAGKSVGASPTTLGGVTIPVMGRDPGQPMSEEQRVAQRELVAASETGLVQTQNTGIKAGRKIGETVRELRNALDDDPEKTAEQVLKPAIDILSRFEDDVALATREIEAMRGESEFGQKANEFFGTAPKDPERVESMAPFMDLTNVMSTMAGAGVRGGIMALDRAAANAIYAATGARAGAAGALASGAAGTGVAALSLETAAEAAAKEAAERVARESATSDVITGALRKTGDSLTKISNAVDNSPMVRGLAAGAATLAAGGEMSSALLGALLGANTRRLGVMRATVGRAGSALSNTATRLADSAPFGALARSMDELAVGAGAGAVAMSPFLLAADTDEERGMMLAGGAAFGAGGSALSKTVEIGGKTVRKVGKSFNVYNVFQPKDSNATPVRPAPARYGLSALDENQALMESQLSDRGAATLGAIRELVSKISDVASEVWFLDSKGVSQLAASHGLQNADGKAGFQLDVWDSNGNVTKRVIAINAEERGIAAGHEPGHVLWEVLTPEQKSQFERAALDVYGEDGVLGFGVQYNELANFQTNRDRAILSNLIERAVKEGNYARVMKLQEVLKQVGKEKDYLAPRDNESRRTQIVKEMFAETVSAYLNGMPFERFGQTSRFGDRVRTWLGAALEKAGALDPKGYADVARTGLGLNPSFTLRGMVENFLTARIDEVKSGATKTVAEEAKVLPAEPAAPVPAADAAPAPVGVDVDGVKNISPVKNKKAGLQGLTIDEPVSDSKGQLFEPGLRVVRDDGGENVKVRGTLSRDLVASDGTVVAKKGDQIDAEIPRKLLESPVAEGAAAAPKPKPVVDVGALKPVPADLAQIKPGTPPPKQPSSSSEAAPAAGKPAAPAPKPSTPNVRVEREQQNQMARLASPEVAASNLELLRKHERKARYERPVFETDYYSARSPISSPDQIVREQQRLAADAAEQDGLPNPLRAIYQKVFVPYKLNTTKNGTATVFGMSLDKVIQNADLLRGWLNLNPNAPRAGEVRSYLQSPDLARDLRTYLDNQSHGYSGDGYRLVRPDDAKPGSITPEDPNYTPVRLDRTKTEVLNLLMGMEQPMSETPGQAFARRFAELNNLSAETIGGVSEMNSVRAELRKAGFDPRILNAAVEQLRVDRMTTPLIERTDLSFPAGDTAMQRAAFMPRRRPSALDRAEGEYDLAISKLMAARDSGDPTQIAAALSEADRTRAEVRRIKDVQESQALAEDARYMPAKRGDIFYLKDGTEVEFLRPLSPQRGGANDGAERAAVRTKPGFDLKYVSTDELSAFPPGVDPDRPEPKKPAANIRELLAGMEGEIRRRRQELEDDFGPRYMPAVGDSPVTSRRSRGNDETRTIVDKYIKAAGIRQEPHSTYLPINEERMKRIADWFDSAKHEPESPEVQAAYGALARETLAQYQAMVNAGIKIEPFTGKGEPYKNSTEMMQDVRDNKHLYFLKTEGAFGEGADATGNPLLADSGIEINGQKLLVNDVFRAVHDFFGHTAEGYEFGPRGEFNAYLAHSRMFSDAAKPALAAETLAQNSWVNFGPHLRRADGSLPKVGDKDFVGLKDRRFADQKTTIVPQDILADVDQADAPAAKFMPAPAIESPEFKAWFGDWEDPKAFTSRAKGPVSFAVDDNGKPLRVYHSTYNEFNTFEMGRPTKNSWAFGEWDTERHAAFFTPDKPFSQEYVADRSRKSRTMELYLSMKSPVDMRKWGPGELYSLGEEIGINPKWMAEGGEIWELFDGADGKAFVEALKREGYDGVIFREQNADGESRDTYAVFSPEQIKSATDNVGTFDGSNPDIRYMPARAGLDKPRFEGERLEHAIPERTLRLTHFSNRKLDVVDPEMMSKDSTRKLLKGDPRSFWMVGDHELRDADGAKGKTEIHKAVVSGAKIYDMRADPLELWDRPQPQIDRTLRDAGYVGFAMETNDGRQFVAMYEPIAFNAKGEKEAAARRAKAQKDEERLANVKLPKKLQREQKALIDADRDWQTMLEEAERQGRPLYELLDASFMPTKGGTKSRDVEYLGVVTNDGVRMVSIPKGSEKFHDEVGLARGERFRYDPTTGNVVWTDLRNEVLPDTREFLDYWLEEKGHKVGRHANWMGQAYANFMPQVYHGTNKGDAFTLDRQKSIYLSTSPDYARHHAERRGEGRPKVLSGSLQLENPADFRAISTQSITIGQIGRRLGLDSEQLGNLEDRIGANRRQAFWQWLASYPGELTSMAKEAGHDGFVFHEDSASGEGDWRKNGDIFYAFSADKFRTNSSAQFMPATFAKDKQVASDFANEFARVAGKDMEGATFDRTGKPANLSSLPIIVTLGSLNQSVAAADHKLAARYFNKHATFLATPNARPGLFRFGDTVSADLNVALPESSLELAKKFAADNDQNSIFNAKAGEVVPTGGSGNTRLTKPEEFAVAAQQLADGTYKSIDDVRAWVKKLKGVEYETLPNINVQEKVNKALRAAADEAGRELSPREVRQIERETASQYDGKIVDLPVVRVPAAKEGKLPLNPSTPEQWDAVNTRIREVLEATKDSPTLALGPLEWEAAFKQLGLGRDGVTIPPAPEQFARYVRDPKMFADWVRQAQKENPALVESALEGLKSVREMHEFAKRGEIDPAIVALHMAWGLASRMLAPFDQEGGWIRLTKNPKFAEALAESIDGKFSMSKETWKNEVVQPAMRAADELTLDPRARAVGKNATANLNAFHDMLTKWNGRWQELADIVNDPKLTGPEKRDEFFKRGFGGAGIKHKVVSFVLLTLSDADVFIGDRWKIVESQQPMLERTAAERGESGPFEYDRNGTPEERLGVYGTYGPLLDETAVGSAAYALIERGLKHVGQHPDVVSLFGRPLSVSDIHWLGWNIIKNEPVGHSSLDLTKTLLQNAQVPTKVGRDTFRNALTNAKVRTQRYNASERAFDEFTIEEGRALIRRAQE